MVYLIIAERFAKKHCMFSATCGFLIECHLKATDNVISGNSCNVTWDSIT